MSYRTLVINDNYYLLNEPLQLLAPCKGPAPYSDWLKQFLE